MTRTWIAILLLVVAIVLLVVGQVQAHDGPLGPWFRSLKSGKGPCCSYTDGLTLTDVDWESKNGHYRVFVEKQWVDVPDEAVIKEPNLAGHTIVWPVYHSIGNAPMIIEIRCFIAGSMG